MHDAYLSIPVTLSTDTVLNFMIVWTINTGVITALLSLVILGVVSILLPLQDQGVNTASYSLLRLASILSCSALVWYVFNIILTPDRSQTTRSLFHLASWRFLHLHHARKVRASPVPPRRSLIRPLS